MKPYGVVNAIPTIQCPRAMRLAGLLTRNTPNRAQTCSTRYFSATTALRTLDLAYDLHEPPNGSEVKDAPIVFMHGLFGSKKNNRSISKSVIPRQE